MFSNKKDTLPPRPHLPNIEHILDDLNNASIDDVSFKIMNKGESHAESTISSRSNSVEENYNKVENYLNIRQKLKDLRIELTERVKQLEDSNAEITKLANEIRNEAEAALIT